MMSKPFRRIVTGHTDDGKAVVLIDDDVPNTTRRPGSGVVNAVAWATLGFPPDISGTSDHAEGEFPFAPQLGQTLLRIIDFPPTNEEDLAKLPRDFMAQQVPATEATAELYRRPEHPLTHRTRSLDYAVVISGKIDMRLDGDDFPLEAGDIVVQQGTNHAWINRSGDVCRMIFVMIGAPDPLGTRSGR